jgi:large subunit ribosomal protein L4
MPKANKYNMAGQRIGEVELSEAVFGLEPNGSVLHASVKNYLANQRQGTQSALTRAEVSGGGRKPWRQKGTGRARAARPEPPTGRTAAWPSLPSPGTTAMPSTGR